MFIIELLFLLILLVLAFVVLFAIWMFLLMLFQILIQLAPVLFVFFMCAGCCWFTFVIVR